MNNFTNQDSAIWAKIPSDHRLHILNEVWCGHCRNTTTMLNISGKIEGGNLILTGKCEKCGKSVGRLVEGE